MGNSFSLLVKKEFVDNRKPLLLGVVGIWASYILLGAFIGNVNGGCQTEFFLFGLLAGLIISIGASLTFNDMKGKEGRINILMLPATALQKFMVRWIAAVPGVLLVVAAGCVMGDLIRMAITELGGGATVSMAKWITVNVGDRLDEWIFVSSIIMWSYLCIQSIYFFGAILWPKLSFIKTLAALQIIQIAGGILLTMWNFNFFHLSLRDMSLGMLTAIIDVIGLLFCLIMYWLSYRRFKRSQVIYKLF